MGQAVPSAPARSGNEPTTGRVLANRDQADRQLAVREYILAGTGIARVRPRRPGFTEVDTRTGPWPAKWRSGRPTQSRTRGLGSGQQPVVPSTSRTFGPEGSQISTPVSVTPAAASAGNRGARHRDSGQARTDPFAASELQSLTHFTSGALVSPFASRADL